MKAITHTGLLFLLWFITSAYDAPPASATPIYLASLQQDTSAAFLLPAQTASSDSLDGGPGPGISSTSGRAALGQINEKGGGVTFADNEIQAEVLALYEATNEDGSPTYAPFRAQVDELHQSDVLFEVSFGRTAPGTFGETRTDGQKVLLIIHPDGVGSLIARLGHEFAHGQQVNRGDLGFRLVEGTWYTDPFTQDVYDEVDAYQAQLEVAQGIDLWKQGGRRSLLGRLVDATTREEQARILLGFRTSDGDRVYAGLENKFKPISYPPSPTGERIVVRKNTVLYVLPPSGDHAAQTTVNQNG